MNIGIIGSGGREHALCFKLKLSKIVDKIYCFPGNAGTNLIAENINIDPNNFEGIKKISNFDVGMLYFLHNFFVKILDPSN